MSAISLKHVRAAIKQPHYARWPGRNVFSHYAAVSSRLAPSWPYRSRVVDLLA